MITDDNEFLLVRRQNRFWNIRDIWINAADAHMEIVQIVEKTYLSLLPRRCLSVALDASDERIEHCRTPPVCVVKVRIRLNANKRQLHHRRPERIRLVDELPPFRETHLMPFGPQFQPRARVSGTVTKSLPQTKSSFPGVGVKTVPNARFGRTQMRSVLFSNNRNTPFIVPFEVEPKT